MKKKTALEIINGIAEKEPSKWLEESEESIASFDWRMKSAKISLRILNEIKARKMSHEMSQKILAEKMGVSPQYVNKILRGQENLSLETICKIEKALGITLVEIPVNTETQNTSEFQTIFDNLENAWKKWWSLSNRFEPDSLKSIYHHPIYLEKYFSTLKEKESENTIG